MGCIKKLARYNVELSDQLLALNERFTDLKDPFSKGYYYHPAFNGSFSIKKVLPALYPNDSSLNYDSLNIKNGGEASLAYKKFHELNDEENKAIKEFLVNHIKQPELYCRFKWENDSVAFWDNRCTAHKGIFDFGQQYRLMHRVAIQGETKPKK